MKKEKHDKKIQKALEDYKDKWLRAMAEYENLKKRFEKEKLEFLQFSNKQLLSELLPIIDDFDRAHEAAIAHKHGEVFSKGVEMILSQLHKLLRDNGVDKVKTTGEKFDPHVHEAIGIAETNEYPEDTVALEISPGYTLNGRLLRAAKVKISEGVKENKDKKGEIRIDKDKEGKAEEDKDKKGEIRIDKDKEGKAEEDKDKKGEIRIDKGKEREIEIDKDKEGETETDTDTKKDTGGDGKNG